MCDGDLKDPDQSNESSDLREMSIGMTASRQEDIQNNIYSMLGDNSKRGSQAGGRGSSISSTRASSSTTASSSSSIRNGSATSSGITSAGHGDDDDDDDDEYLYAAAQEAAHALSGQAYGSVDLQSDWACSTCTLLNARGTDTCEVCGVPRY